MLLSTFSFFFFLPPQSLLSFPFLLLGSHFPKGGGGRRRRNLGNAGLPRLVKEGRPGGGGAESPLPPGGSEERGGAFHGFPLLWFFSLPFQVLSIHQGVIFPLLYFHFPSTSTKFSTLKGKREGWRVGRARPLFKFDAN